MGKLTQQAPSYHSQPQQIPAGSLKTSSCIFMLRCSRSSLCKGAGVKLVQPRVQPCLPTLTMVLGKSCHPTASILPPEKREIRFSLACVVRIICLGRLCAEVSALLEEKKKPQQKEKEKKKSSAKKAQAKKHSQGVCTSAACLRKAASSIFNLEKEPLPSPPAAASHHCRLTHGSHLPSRDVHPDPRAKQQLFLS